MIRTYSELIRLPSFIERYRYLRIAGTVGKETFGFDRYLNQIFYKSDEWLEIRDYVIDRDNGCDLGVDGFDIEGRILIHHMNPISKEDILRRSKFLLDPEYLITTVKNTHDAIHFGNEDSLYTGIVERSPNDMCPWKR